MHEEDQIDFFEEEELGRPKVPHDVVAYLERVFPDMLPKTEVSTYDLGYLVGMQAIVAHLKSLT